MSRQEQDERREDEGDRNRQNRHGGDEPPGLPHAAFDPHQCSLPAPAIRRPSSSTVAVSASRSPTTLPSYITATRSASARISSRSSLMRRTPTPVEAASRRYECTVSIPATSRPRVGAAATSTAGSPENSRASTSFWRLPPESCHAGTL